MQWLQPGSAQLSKLFIRQLGMMALMSLLVQRDGKN